MVDPTGYGVKKIAIVVCAWPPYAGGIPQNAFGQAVNLSRLGYQVTVFTPNYGQEKIQPPGFTVKFLYTPFKFGLAAFVPQLFWHLRKFELVHFYYPFYGAVKPIISLKVFCPKIKLVVHHEMEAVGRGFKKIFFKLHAKLFLPWVVRLADKIIVLSEDYALNCELAGYYQKFRSKFIAIGNGVTCEKFQPGTKDLTLLNKLSLTLSDKILLFVGGLDTQHYFKGVEILLTALKQLKAPAKLLIVGEGNLKNSYQAKAVALGVDQQVVFVGQVANTALPKYYKLADIFVLPAVARTESFSTATAEAQSCGVPAVVSNLPGLRQTIIDGQTGLLFKVGDSFDLAEKLTKLLTDENRRRQLGQAAAIRAQELFSWSKIIQQIIAVYNSL
ncbi:MAG: glycosyltransferase family 4 protein [Candidatus Buchananbacteria bacterium]